MKYLCDGCERLIEPGSVAVEPGGVVLTCPRCRHPTRLGAQTPALASLSVPAPALAPSPSVPAPQAALAPQAPLAPPVPVQDRCPKCATPKNGRDSCARCGLVFELYRADKDEKELAPARAEFEKLLLSWGTPDAQKQLDRVGTQRLALLARVARLHLADFPQDARAQAILDGLAARSLALAGSMQANLSTGSAGGVDVKRYLIIGVIVASLAAMGAGALYLKRFLSQGMALLSGEP